MVPVVPVQAHITYKGWIGSWLTYVNKGIFVNMLGCIGVSE